MTIGDRIKQRRMELGMSQEELAHKLGFDGGKKSCVLEAVD